MGGRILSPRERSFQLFSVIDPLTTDAMSLEFMDGIPAQKAFDMAEATCGKQLLSNTKAGSGGSAGGQARHRPQGELALIVKWVHHIRGMKGWSRISEHQDRVNFLASIQGGWENLLPASPALQAIMAQPQTGHATRQQSAIQGAEAAAEPAQVKQSARPRKRKRPVHGPVADSLSQKNDDDDEFLKGSQDRSREARTSEADYG